MGRIKFYEVLDEFDPEKDYGIHLYPQQTECLLLLKKGQIVSQKDFLEEHIAKITRRSTSRDVSGRVVSTAFGAAEQIGLLQKVKPYKTSFQEFCQKDTVSYCIKQLRGSKFKNIKKTSNYGLSSTQMNYAYALWRFNNWLENRDFEYHQLIQTSEKHYLREKTQVKLEGLEHFFRLFVESHQSESEFAKVIKRYLMDPHHKDKRASTIQLYSCAIKAYFDRNDSPIKFRFDSKATHKVTDQDDDQPSLTLDDLLKMLTVGRPTVAQKAIILSKFHRGLDTSTFVDRFNFQAWQQMADWFETEVHTKWDLDKCPVPIKLTRIKTGFTHTGFLERDAVEAIQQYLDWREKKTRMPMSPDQPLFLNLKGEPVSVTGLRRLFNRLANAAGIQKRLNSYNLREKYEKDSHELRDLLKSILIDCGCRYDVTDHFIGHKPKDSYEKQTTMFPQTLREEYQKAAFKLNIFSNISNNMQKSANVQELQKEVVSLREQVIRLLQKETVTNQVLQETQK